MTVLVWAAAGLLGGVGALARVESIRLAVHRLGVESHVATFAVNVSGAAALGVLAGADVGGDALLLAGTALLGAFTTFSTWMFESVRLAQSGRRAAAAANLALPLLAGLAAAAAGYALGTTVG